VSKEGQKLKSELERKLIGPDKLTRYELARIVGARALQIALGAPVLIEVPQNLRKDPIDIALYELKLGILPIVVRRRLPDGRYQDIPLRALLKRVNIKQY